MFTLHDGTGIHRPCPTTIKSRFVTFTFRACPHTVLCETAGGAIHRACAVTGHGLLNVWRSQLFHGRELVCRAALRLKQELKETHEPPKQVESSDYMITSTCHVNGRPMHPTSSNVRLYDTQYLLHRRRPMHPRVRLKNRPHVHKKDVVQVNGHKEYIMRIS